MSERVLWVRSTKSRDLVRLREHEWPSDGACPDLHRLCLCVPRRSVAMAVTAFTQIIW